MYLRFILCISAVFLGTISSENCVVEKNRLRYDFSSLSRRDYWEYVDSNDENRVFVMSVCHKVRTIPGCDAGVCMIQRKPGQNLTEVTPDMVTDLGHFEDPKPSVVNKNLLTYSFLNGSVCDQNLQYKTEIYFNCPSSHKIETNGPVLLSSFHCNTVFVWVTLAACHFEADPTIDACIVKLSNSEYTLNLHSLTSPSFYTVNDGNSTFEVNICGSTKSGQCKEQTSICDISGQYPRFIAGAGKEKVRVENGEVVLSYFHENRNISANVHMHCSTSDFIPRIYFMGETEMIYNFSVYSVNLCMPRSTDCLLEDQNLNLINLKPLRKMTGNYELPISQNSQDKSSMIYFNLCGPLTHPESLNCTSGLSGACLSTQHSKSSSNLGYITSDPKVNEDGTISILYTGGDNCSDSSPVPLSTRLTLICSSIQMGPFVVTNSGCQYNLLWYTPSACPVGVSSSNDCVIEDRLYGHTFDLNPLRNTTKDYDTSDGQNTYYLNVCGPLVNSCGEEKSVSVCRKGPEGDESGGSSKKSELLFNDGTILMKFKNGQNCSTGGEWSSQILILCTHDQEANEGPQFIHTDSSCTHYFMWYTPLACPPFEVTDCFVSDGENKYDLSSLSNSRENEVYFDQTRNRKFVLNVCRSVLHSKEARCSYDSGACLVGRQKEKTQNLGKVSSGPYLDEGQLKIKYSDGDLCNNVTRYSTVIEFVCTVESEFSYPYLVAEDNCVFAFKYFTPHACPQKIEVQEPKNCSVLFPGHREPVSLDYLSQRTNQLKINETHSLLFSVCSAVSDPRCKQSESGACVVGPSNSSGAGRSNRHLKAVVYSPFLQYEGGDETCDNGLKRSTTINFICHRPGFAGSYGPVLVSDDSVSCIYTIHWHTELVCPREFKCIAQDWQKRVDLSPLSAKNYIVEDPSNKDNSYVINVCQPVLSQAGLNCPPGPSACLSNPDRSLSLNLGWAMAPPIFSGGNVQLMYAKGSACPQNSNLNLTTKILFICNQSAGMGSPKFSRKTHDCVLEFVWETQVACSAPEIEDGACQIKKPWSEEVLDLAVLKFVQPYRVRYETRSYLINICGAPGCGSGAAICTLDDDEYFGDSKHFALKWGYQGLQMSFYRGSPCKGSVSGKRSATIFFECDPTAGYGSPVPDPIMKNTNCIAIFTWKTSLTCRFVGPEVTSNSSVVTPPSTPVTSGLTTPAVVTTEKSDFSTLPLHPPPSSWILNLITTATVVGVLALVAFFVFRSTRGRRIYERLRRSFNHRGDQVFILDDHL